MTVQGDGQIIRNPDTGAGSGSWRGLQVARTSSAASFPAGTAFAAPFNHADFDTDAIALASPVTFGGVTVPGNGGGVVPADMAGLWRLGAHVNAQFNPTTTIFQTYGLKINNVRGPVFNIVTPGFAGSDSIIPLIVPPVLYRLAEGDTVWFYMAAPTVGVRVQGSDGTILTNSWLLMEYLIPWALDDT